MTNTSLDSSIILKFRRSITEQIEDRRFAISQGNFSDIIQYKEQCAQINGLNVALELFNELVKKLSTDEEE